MDDGSVFAWGGTLHKKVGEKNSASQNNEPRLVAGLQSKNIIFIDCGDFHSLALDSEGRLYTWGGGGASYNKG
jgi:alpha-tubulin suppressor-like RCC1 family protein